MKKLISVLLFICILLLTASCSKNEDKKKEVVYSAISEPSTIDPQAITDSYGETLVLNIFEGLMREDSDGNIISAVAKEYFISNDKKTYIFILNENARWSDNSELTADDFVFGFKRAVISCKNLSDIGGLAKIKNSAEYKKNPNTSVEFGAKAINKHLLKIDLSEACEDFLYDLCKCYAMPCNRDFFEASVGQYGKESKFCLSNGPFYIPESYGWQHNQYINIVENPYYSGNIETKISGVYLEMNSKEEPLKLLLDNQIDLIVTDSSNYDIIKSNNFEIKQYTDKIWCLAFNLNNEILKNDDIRKGLCLSLNRTEILSELPNHYARANTLFTKAFYYDNRLFDNSYSFKEYDVKQAKKYVEKGLKKIKRSDLNSLTVISNDLSFLPSVTTKIITAWNKISLSYINKENISDFQLENSINSKNYTAAIVPIKITGNNPYDILKNFYENNQNNFIGLKNDEYNSFIDNPTYENLIKAENFLYDNNLIYPLYYEDILFVTAKNVKNIIFNPYSEVINYIYCEKITLD